MYISRVGRRDVRSAAYQGFYNKSIFSPERVGQLITPGYFGILVGSTMTMKSFKFNKSNLGSLVSAGTPVTVRDTEVTGLRFKTGVKRSVFSFQKRLSRLGGLGNTQ